MNDEMITITLTPLEFKALRQYLQNDCIEEYAPEHIHAPLLTVRYKLMAIAVNAESKQQGHQLPLLPDPVCEWELEVESPKLNIRGIPDSRCMDLMRYLLQYEEGRSPKCFAHDLPATIEIGDIGKEP